MAGKKAKVEAAAEAEDRNGDAGGKEVIHVGGVHRVVLQTWRWGDDTKALTWNSEDNSLAVMSLLDVDDSAQEPAESESNGEGEGDDA